MSVFTSRHLAGAYLALAMMMGVSQPVMAQVNPFIPSGGISRVEADKLTARLQALEDQVAKSGKAAPAAGAALPGTPGAPGAPGVPGAAMTPGGPKAMPGVGATGAAVPGGYGPVAGPVGGMPGLGGNMGAGMGMVQKPVDPIVEARSQGVRFLGCINGTPKFVKSTGERISFTASEINKAIKSGVLPACR